MIFDLIVFTLCSLAVYTGWKRGALSALAGTIGVYLAIIIALRFSNGFGDVIQSLFGWQKQMPGFVSFILTVIATLIGFGLIVKLLTRTIDLTLLGPVNRTLGALMASGTALYIISTVMWYANTASLVSDSLAESSSTFQYVVKFGPAFNKITAYIIPLAKDIHSQISQELP